MINGVSSLHMLVALRLVAAQRTTLHIQKDETGAVFYSGILCLEESSKSVFLIQTSRNEFRDPVERVEIAVSSA